jgi:hypothetical protein
MTSYYPMKNFCMSGNQTPGSAHRLIFMRTEWGEAIRQLDDEHRIPGIGNRTQERRVSMWMNTTATDEDQR